MPFCPLPGTFVDDLRRAGPGAVLELGSGDGTFTGLIQAHAPDPVTLDRRGPRRGCRPSVCGDALRPPLRGGFAVVVAPNLLRHLWRRVQRSGPLAWRDLVAPGGCLWILEDLPAVGPGPAGNYRDLQGLLARLDPAGRGPLLDLQTFRDRCSAWRWPGRWRSGRRGNAWPLDAGAVVAWLGSEPREPGGEVDRLVSAIDREGLSCGDMWWARWQPEETS